MKLYDLPIKTFNPENLMEEILKANDGDVFVIKEENVAENIGEYKSEITTIQVRKVREPENHDVASPNYQTKAYD